MKKILQILIFICLLGVSIGYTSAAENLKNGTQTTPTAIENDKLNNYGKTDPGFFDSNFTGEKGLKYTFIKVAKDMKVVFFLLASLYLFILVLKLLFTDNTEEESENFKKGIIWTSVGLVIMQIAYSFISVLYDEGVGGGVAFHLIDNVIEPLINILLTALSFVFIAVSILAFYKIVTANGEEEKAKEGKMTIVYAIIGYVVVRFAKTLIEATYGKLNCDTVNIGGIFQINNAGANCIKDAVVSDSIGIITDIINWANSFIGIVIVIMIIYAGAQVLLSSGDEDKLKNAKFSIIFIAIGLALLFANYLILTFFIFPESAI